MKKAIITGASSGLGLEVGKQLKNNGFEVINISRNISEFINITCDLCLDENLNKTIAEIKKKHFDFNILILNAGIMPKAKIGEIDFDIDKLFQINITSNIKLINGLTELIIKNKADIVIVGSTASFNSYSEDSVYSSTKHAILGFIKYLQAEFKTEEVRIIGFHPGGFNSNLRGEGVFKEGYMNPKELAKIMIQILELPKNMEVSEIIINRKRMK